MTEGLKALQDHASSLLEAAKTAAGIEEDWRPTSQVVCGFMWIYVKFFWEGNFVVSCVAGSWEIVIDII